MDIQERMLAWYSCNSACVKILSPVPWLQQCCFRDPYLSFFSWESRWLWYAQITVDISSDYTLVRRFLICSMRSRMGSSSLVNSWGLSVSFIQMRPWKRKSLVSAFHPWESTLKTTTLANELSSWNFLNSDKFPFLMQLHSNSMICEKLAILNVKRYSSNNSNCPSLIC